MQVQVGIFTMNPKLHPPVPALLWHTCMYMYIYKFVNMYMYMYMHMLVLLGICLFLSLHSIGEVGWRLTPGYDTPHSTLGAQTLQLLSSTGNAGDALSSRADHTATVHAPGTTTCTAEDNDKEECLEKAVGIELEEADIGQNHSTSTLVNEDSILTPTQSSSSLSALTLTEISRMEGSQSTTVQLKKGGEDTPMDTRQKELAATSEATSQLSLKLDECAHEDKPLDKPPGCTSTESVTTSQLLAGKKAAGNGDSVEGIGDNGGTRREMVGREVEGGAELSQGLGRIDVDGHPKQEPDTSLVISDIVRSEMKKILEVCVHLHVT